jgi:hypothetical protein
MAATYDELMEDLKKNQYIPKTQEELAKEAAGRYDSVYAQKNLAAQQATDTAQLALDKQLNSLSAATAKQREDSTKAYNNAYSQAGRQALKTGMGRSSYNLATQANISNAANKALQGISDAEVAERNGIEGQKALLASQLAQTLQQYATGKASDINSYLDELLSREFERKTASEDKQNSINLQLLQLQQEQDKLDEEKRQFDKLHPPKKSSSGSGKGSGKGGNPGGQTDYDKLRDGLNGAGANSGAPVKSPPAFWPLPSPLATLLLSALPKNTAAPTGSMVLPPSAVLENWNKQQQQKGKK